MASTVFGLGVSLSTSVFASTSGFSSKMRSQPACFGVTLSTKTGAACECGKFTIKADALQAMAMGEVRQIVASGFKLAHGTPLGTITWGLT